MDAPATASRSERVTVADALGDIRSNFSGPTSEASLSRAHALLSVSPSEGLEGLFAVQRQSDGSFSAPDGSDKDANASLVSLREFLRVCSTVANSSSEMKDLSAKIEADLEKVSSLQDKLKDIH